MTNLDIAHRRLHNQFISRRTFEKPGDVVSWLGAVQAQDYLGALWALGLRMQDAVEADIEQAMADGVIVRTHPMRGTWHFVAAADIRWLLTLMAPGRIANNAPWYRRLELDEATFAKSNAIFAQTLQGGKQLTRQELAAALGQAGISTKGLRLTFILSRAEIEGVIASGARRGKQFTFALLDELIPASRSLERDEALAELAHRYFTSHGPATPQDFVWWSGLTAADARVGLEIVKSQLVKETIDGQIYWLSPSTETVNVSSPTAYLLPAYDEYTVAYKDRSAVLDPAYAEQTGNGIFNPTITVDGQIVGTWKRTFKKDGVVITQDLFRSLSEAENQAIAAAVERYGRFIGKSVVTP
ncbi:MAG TPA: winged helix DNA-binding domain-containing protein [Ktedonobacteraceae bacterium]